MIQPCVGCGYCCQKVTCVLGLMRGAPESGTCPFLEWCEAESCYRCRLVTAAATHEERKMVEHELAIGAGCCSSLFNTQREAAIRRQAERAEPARNTRDEWTVPRYR